MDASSERLTRLLLAEGKPSHVFELHYWSLEPGLLPIIRAVASMTEQSRSALETFIALAGPPASIEADVSSRGALTLTSPEVSKAVALAHYVAANDLDKSYLN